ncbi:hypothetical protein HDU76_013061 [Blyttiomyces sp. JEL0837]|nr:hypothetical protein HDU76_013061 [Blyttiomyces sp. JEL0837]
MKVSLAFLTTLTVSIAATVQAVSNSTIQTIPIIFPQNEYFVTSNLIAAIEYLHRAFPDHPAVYTRDGNFVYNYVDPVSGNVTDLVEPSDLFLNANSLSDVVVGVETVMYNQIPNPDTDPVSLDVIANLKIATNYITNIASYDFSTLDQGTISTFYNFTATRYQNLFARENTTALIPLTPITLTNNVNATSAPTPLLYNISVFDAIDGNTFNNTLGVDHKVLASNMMKKLAQTLEIFGIPVTIVNGTNTTTTSTSTITPTPVSSTIQSTTAEPTLTDTNDPGCDFDTCFRRRGRRAGRRHQERSVTGEIILMYEDPEENGQPRPNTVTGTTSGIQIISSSGEVLSQGLGGSTAPEQSSSQETQSFRAYLAKGGKSALQAVQKVGKATGTAAKKGVETAIKESFNEASKGTGIGGSALVGAMKGAGALVAELSNNAGDSAISIINADLADVEKTAITTAMTEFFGLPKDLVEKGVEAVFANENYAESTTLTKTIFAISVAVQNAPPGSFPEFDDKGIESWVGNRIDKILQKKYNTQNINRNTKIEKAGSGYENYPHVEFDALRIVLEGVTDKVASSVEFDEEKYFGGLAREPEGTFGYEITASKGIDEAIGIMASITTSDAVTSNDNVGFIKGAILKYSQDGDSGKFVAAVKASKLGQKAFKMLGKNAMRARTDNGQGELQMDPHAQEICNALGDKAFSGMTKNVRTQLKSTTSRGPANKSLVKNNSRTIFSNKAPVKAAPK